MAYANYYEIGLSKEMADELADLKDCDTDELQTFLNRIDMSALKNILKRGDVIGLLNYPGYGYRNDGKVMWDGNRLVDLEYGDEYGNVPPKFIVGKEFDNAFYWQQSIEQKTFMDSGMTITHNYYIYASFDKNLVSNIIRDGNFFTFDYNRGGEVGGVTEVWKIFTNNIDQYFRHKPVLSASYYHLEEFFEMFKISKHVDVSRYIIDISYMSILSENDYDLSECEFEEYDYDGDDDYDDECDDDDEKDNDDDDEKVPPIFFRDANDKTKSSQYIINCIDNDLDEIVSQPFESSYSFVDYTTRSVWTWKRVENNYTIELTMNDSEDLTKFKNLEIATVYEYLTWRQTTIPKTKYSYIWNNKIDTNFVLTFNNSLKFLVKKYGLISSHQVLELL